MMKKSYYSDHDYYDYGPRGDYGERRYKNREDLPYEDYNEYHQGNYNHKGDYRKSKSSLPYTYDDEGYYNNEYPDKDEFEKENKSNSQLLTIIQIISCTIIILGVLALKTMAPQYYELFSDWYNTEINKSVIAGDSLQYGIQIPNSSELDLQQPSQESASIKATSDNKCNKIVLSKPIKDDVIITSEFGEMRDEKSHKGLDLATNEGTKIYCPLDGIVEKVAENDSYGKYVIVEHENGIKTLYAHCNSIEVNAGDNVITNQYIASVGSTGDSTGPHLHFELIINNENCDPLKFMNEAYI